MCTRTPRQRLPQADLEVSEVTVCPVSRRSPTFWAPGTGFVEDNFSTDGEGADCLGGNVSPGEPWGTADTKLRSFSHRSPPAVRPSS